MKLYTRWQNSAGERVRIALNLKGLDYDYVAVGSLAPGEYQRINPLALMPTLEVDGQVIAQSAAILDYLEERYPSPSLLPDDLILRAQARAFGAAIAAEMHAIAVNRVRKFLIEDLALGEAGADRWAKHWHKLGFEALEATLARRAVEFPFCFSDEPGWADLHLVPQLARSRGLGVDVSPYKRLLAVEARCVDLPAFRKARPDQQIDYPGAG